MSRKNNYLPCIAVSFLLTTPLFADTSIDASLKVLHFDYEEFDEFGVSSNKETGFIPGLSLSVAKTLVQTSSLIGIEFYGGQVDYDGQTQQGVPHKTNTDETLFRLFYKLSWSPENKHSSIYGKVAWQQWDRDILTTNNVAGLFERYQWWVVELGFHTALFESRTDKWLLDIGVLKTSNGSIKIDLIPYGYGQPELDLGDGIGATAGLSYQYQQSERNTIGFSLQYQRWTFGRSNTETISNGFEFRDITEPRSVSSHSSISFNYGYHF